ncbi:MAG: RtcB family protein [Gammaproteobacteria bacterium]
MDLNQLRQMDECCWTSVDQTSNAPVTLFGTLALLTEMDDKVLEQISNVAQLPGLVGAAMTMPDAHWGYGFPIGGVAAFDAEQGGIISAGGVGFDISCGIRCLRTDLTLNDLQPRMEALADHLFQTIPAGIGKEGRIQLSIKQIDDVLSKGARWAVAQGYGTKEDLTYIEEQGCVDNAEPDQVSDHAKKRQRGEMGTLGAGNHYLEVQVVEKIYDEVAAQAFGLEVNQIIISIHCGSRGLGHQIGTDYLLILAKAAQRLGLSLPDRELACAPIKSEEGQRYIGAMHAAINCALANRQILTHLTRGSFELIFPKVNVDTLFDVSHNTCKIERHNVEGQSREVYIHRKGATRAFGPNHPDLPLRYRSVGQPVIVGGSMGTGSYILVGESEVNNRAFSSACHGAGRAMSRRQALKRWRGRDVIDELAGRGILIRSRSMRDVAEEAPGAYKDVDLVVTATEQAKLAKRVALLRPKICVKG